MSIEELDNKDKSTPDPVASVVLHGGPRLRSVRQQFVNFRDRNAFPIYVDLAGEKEFHPNYYVADNDSMVSYKKHWAILSEIVEAFWVMRLVISVRDRAGKNLVVLFNTPLIGAEIPDHLWRTGYTVIHLYGLQHKYMNGQDGFCVEDMKSIKIVPMSMDHLMRLGDRVNHYSEIFDDKLMTCHGCDTQEENLKMCARCKMFFYCNRGCQRFGWYDRGHKEDCKVLKDKDVRMMLRKNWKKYDHDMEFH